MSEIVEKVKNRLWDIINPMGICASDDLLIVINEILSIPELAIVDREAILPRIKAVKDEDADYAKGADDMREVIRMTGWVKEVI